MVFTHFTFMDLIFGGFLFRILGFLGKMISSGHDAYLNKAFSTGIVFSVNNIR